MKPTHIPSALIVLLLVICIVGCYKVNYLFHITPRGYYSNLNNETGNRLPIGEITDGITVKQILPCDKGTTGISIMFATYERQNSGNVAITITGIESGTTYVSESYDTDEFINSSFMDVLFEKSPVSDDNEIMVIISSNSPANEAITAWRSENDSIPDHALIINDIEQSGDLICRTIVENHAIKQYLVIVLGLGLLSFVCAVLVLILKRTTIEKTYAIFSLLMGMLYMFSITPLSVPDEPHHYHSSYELSNVFRLHWDKLEYGYNADFDYSQFAGHNNVGSAYCRIVDDFTDPAMEGNLIQIPHPRALLYPVEYFPQAIGISISKFLNANFIVTFFSGRLCNLLFYIFCALLAIKNTPKFKLLFCVIGLLPMTLHQAASYSYDGFINGVSLLLIALVMKSIYKNTPFEKKEIIQLSLVGALLAPAKPVYLPLLFMLFLVPRERFKNQKQKLAIICIIWIIALLSIGIFQLTNLASIAAPTGSSLNWEGARNYTISYIIRHPLRTATIFMNTFLLMCTTWFGCSIGSHLSGLSLFISIWTIFGFILLLLASSLSGINNTHIHPRCKLCFIGISVLIIFLVMLYMFLIWTSDYRTTIEGVQGRYFIPILPLLFMSCNNNTFIVTKSIEKVVLFFAVIFNLDVILQILTLTVAH